MGRADHNRQGEMQEKKGQGVSHPVIFALLTILLGLLVLIAALFLAAMLSLEGLSEEAPAFFVGILVGGVFVGCTWYQHRHPRPAAEQAPAVEEDAAVPATVAAPAPVPAADVPTDTVEPQDTADGPVAEALPDIAAHVVPAASAPDPVAVPLASVEVTSTPSRFSSLSLDELSQRLVGVPDPLTELKLIAGDISAREKAWTGRGLWSGGRRQAERDRRIAQAMGQEPDPLPEGPDPDPEEAPIPSGLELYLAHQLLQTGLYDEDFKAPRLHIVRPHASGMFYLRVEQAAVPYATMLVILRVEAVLNAVRFVCRYFDNPEAVSEEECVRLRQRITSSIAAQAAPIDEPLDLPEGVDPDGEWAVRHGISRAIESFRLPYRLVADYRTNVADGNVAIEVRLTPADVFPSSYYAPGLPTSAPIKSTRTTRRQAASAYALRLAVLLAACALRTSEKIKHVWVAGVLDTATRHDCYFSIDFDRWRFAKVDLEEVDDLERVLHPFCPVMRLEDGFLRPVQQTFSLAEERFCPRRRYESVTLSSRRLTGKQADALGTDHVSGLAIAEADKREAVADDILRRLVGPSNERACEHNVRTILEIAGDDPDPSVRSAAERTVVALTQGAIAEDPLAVVEEFVSGDELTQACNDAQRALESNDPERALELVRSVLSPIDEAGIYEDSDTVEWRHFENFADRALYNRLSEHPERSLMLVPASYYNAHTLAMVAHMVSNRAERAIGHAQTLVRIAPLDTRAHLQLVRCLEFAGRMDEAAEQLRRLLLVAHDPQSIGTAYYRMAFFQWQQGNVLSARACYAIAMRLMPASAGTVAVELATLAMQSGIDSAILEHELSEQEIADALAAGNIPKAPTESVTEAFIECTRAAVDAEVFPVARTLMSTLAAFSPDDITVGMARSLEDAPDSL